MNCLDMIVFGCPVTKTLARKMGIVKESRHVRAEEGDDLYVDLVFKNLTLDFEYFIIPIYDPCGTTMKTMTFTDFADTVHKKSARARAEWKRFQKQMWEVGGVKIPDGEILVMHAPLR